MHTSLLPGILCTLLIGCTDSSTPTRAMQTTPDTAIAESVRSIVAKPSIQLTREAAQQKIMEGLHYPKRQSSELRKFFSYSMSYQQEEKQRAITQLYWLRDNGYIEVTESTDTDALRTFARFQIQVTEKGCPFNINEYTDQYLLNSHNEVVTVPGVSIQPDGMSAIAEYSVDWEMTPFGKYFFYNVEKRTPRVQQIPLRRFDDGWRVSIGAQ